MKKWKRVLSVVLAAVMLAGLCACGGKNNGEGSSDGKRGGNVNSELAKQYVYRMEEFDLSSAQMAEGDNYVQNIMASGDRLYITMQSYSYTEGGNNSQYRLVSMNPDGSDMKIYELQSALDGEEGAQESSEEQSASSAEGGDTASISPRAETAESEIEIDVSNVNIYENTNLGNFQIDGDRLLGVKNYNYEDYSDPENYVSIRKNYVCAWDLEGRMLWESEVAFPEEEEGSWYYIHSVISLGDGTAVLLIAGNQTGKMTVDKEGKLSEMQPFEDLDKYMENSGSYAVLPDGKLLMTYYGDNWTDMFAITYDFKNGSAGVSAPIPTSVANRMGNINVDANGDLLYTNNMGVFKYHIGDTEGVQMMSFVNSDMDINNLGAIYPTDDDHFVGMYSEYDNERGNSTVKGGIFTRVDPKDIPDKQVLVLGGNYIDSEIKKRVIEYNKSSNTHRIVLRDYSQYITDDYSAGYTQMNNDIISGNMPDILILDAGGLSLENYISKGLIADIGEMIEKDEELAGTEFMENVFEACKVDGKLYEIIPAFSVRTYIGKKSLVGEPENWTMEEAEKCLGSMAEGASLFGDVTRGEFFSYVMGIRGSDFIDVSTGKCNFDSEEFISLMEFAKKLPQERGDDYYEDNWYMAYESQYRENRTLLMSCYIYDIVDMVYTINGSFGEDVSYVGFPNAGGQGSVIQTNTTYALAAGSADLEEAWNFMRYYLTDEYQKALEWELPINKKYFDERAEKATQKPTYTDENGKEVENDYTWWINDESVVLDPLTAQQLEEVKSFVSSVTKRAYYNQDVQNIIDEEMEAFYQGQKSAKDVAGVIQSRAQIFVNENR